MHFIDHGPGFNALLVGLLEFLHNWTVGLTLDQSYAPRFRKSERKPPPEQELCCTLVSDSSPGSSATLRELPIIS